MKKEQEHKPLEPGRFYRFRPTMSQANIVGPYLVDLEGLNIQFFNLKDFTLFKRIQILSKDDQYCAQIRVLSQKILVILTIDKFMLFNIESMQISENVKTNSYIQKLEVRNNFIVILSSDEDSEYKVVNCWKINPQTGKIQEKYKSTQFMLIDNQECTQDNMLMNLILSIQGSPKVYVYWAATVYMIEVDPIQQVTEKYNRHSKVQLSFDLTKETYAEIIDKSIVVNNKRTGKKVAQLMNEGQNFTQIFTDGSSDTIYTLSNFGLKKWKLQSNKAPTLYACPQNIKFHKIFISPNHQVIALDLQSNSVLQYKNEDEYNLNTFPTETVRKCLKISNNLAFFLLEASSTSFEENQYQVSKYNKLEIFDFNEDNEIAKKAMLKSQHSVDADSIVIGSQGDTVTIRFIVNEKAEEGDVQRLEKKYVLRWTPFQKDQNGKDTKRKELKGANAFDVVKMYPFNRILGITFAKKAQSFSLFTKQQQKTQLIIYDFSAKKMGEYDLQGELLNIEVSQRGQMFTIGPNRISIYSIMSENKNRLQKVTQLDISALSLTPINDMLLIQKQNSFILLNSDFQCIIKEESKQGQRKYKAIPVRQHQFLLKTQSKLQLWDTQEESTKDFEIVQCQPSLVEYMDGKIVVADKWIQVYDLKLQ